MESNQRELRHAAAQAFIESLNKLQETLTSEASQPTQSAANGRFDKTAPPKRETVKLDLSSLEQAAEDIEQFIQSRKEKQAD